MIKDSKPYALFQRVAGEVPAYRAFLAEHGINPATVADFAEIPLVTKANYLARFPLSDRCRTGDVADCDMVAFSSGSTGEPTLWPRKLSDEIAVASSFERVFVDSFGADRKRTLAIVCFPLGTWVGGMYTASCCRHLATRGLRITTVTPGNDRAEILRVARALAPMFDQTVLLGYPPFLKDVIDAGVSAGVPWSAWSIKLVCAGEVFSEEWRSLMAERAGMKDVLRDSASLYGTADAGILGTETPLTVAIRRFCAENEAAARSLFGEARLPTLVQYDPETRFFERHENTLVVTADGGVPLVRYHIADDGGLFEWREMIDRVRALGFDPLAVDGSAEGGTSQFGSVSSPRELPFAYVFGRSHFAISFYGANVFPEMISVALDQPALRAWVTGKFVMQARETASHDRRLAIAVELAADVTPTDAMRDAIAEGIVAQLRRLNSEFLHYVPADAQRPEVSLHGKGDPEHFPIGVKHRYSRR